MEEEAIIDNVVELRSGISRVFEEMVEQRRTVAGIHISPDTSLQCSAVLGCVRVLSSAIAQLPCHLMRRRPDGGKEIAMEHPLNELLAYQPNSWMTAYEYKELCQSHLLLWGNSYSLIKSGRRGSVSELIPLHPSRMSIQMLENGRLRYTYQQPDTAVPEVYTQDQIFHLRWLSQDGITGFVPTTLSRDAIALARATELHSGAYFGNGARPGAVIETSQPLKPESMERLRRSFEDYHKGSSNSGRTAVMPFGTSIKEYGVVNSQQNETLATRRYQVEEVARCYQIPAHMIGNLENVRFSTVEQSAIDFVTFSLMPHLRRWEQACRRDLVVDDNQYFVEFDIKDLMVGDHAARSQFLREMFNMGVLSVDELRMSIGENPLPNGEGDKRFIQVNMQLLEAFTPESPTGDAQPQASQGSQEVVEDEGEEPTAGEEEPDTKTRSIGRHESEGSDASEALWQTTLTRLASIEAGGILDRRHKQAKLEAFLQQHEGRMRSELSASGKATHRDTEAFVIEWMNRSRDLLHECHVSGKPYEEVLESWTSRTN